MKVPFIIYADLESLLEKTNMCQSNPKNSSTTKINLHTACVYSLFTYFTFVTTKNKLDFYRGKVCIKSFCKDFKKHATEIIKSFKKEMIPLTAKKSHISDKTFVIYVKKIIADIENSSEAMFIKYRRVRDH